jgi:hypothetical protein
MGRLPIPLSVHCRWEMLFVHIESLTVDLIVTALSEILCQVCDRWLGKLRVHVTTKCKVHSVARYINGS